MASSMPMYFLRPLSLPRSATLTRFLGISRLSTSTSTTSTPAATTTTPTKGTALPYRISRTPSKNLPIYLLAKAGGNLKQTKIRKIEGNIGALKSDLQQALGLGEKEVVINQLTKHIIIKGWKKPEVTKFLEERQF
ncbi:mitochondrial large subunit ribosomal protein-domain-containing protein [Xylogone sp. PMI_703]|nr:mitochondrial large subunit ribosomal protein-domain-containing protein [Xylogone sp. PMI_703]